jgi:glycine/D-amino acid oxidase-like deaminating enzyme
MDVAVVGGGVFGVTAAVEVAQRVADAEVTLYERAHDIFTAASGVNQWRLHRGYHYPRSESTARTCRDAESAFRDRYEPAVIAGHEHYYCIASERTKTSPDEYLAHCERVGLDYERADLDVVAEDGVDLCLRVEENHIDPLALESVAWRRLNRAGVDVRLDTEVDSATALADEYDYVVVAAYAGNNGLVEDYSALHREYKFQVIEKPVVTLPEQFHDRSVVVMDGPFMSFDPYGHTARFQFDHVVWGVRHESVGDEPSLGDVDPSLLNAGLIEDPPDSNFSAFVDAYREFFPGVDDATHLGSYFTVRTVLPNREATDARPTLVDRSSNVFRIFSGKISTCVAAADRVVEGLRAG